jgi:hypothetical protein
MKLSYRGYTIEFSAKPIPDRSFDWDWTSDDYDGPGDDRCGNAASEAAAMNDVDANIRDNGGVAVGSDVIAKGQPMHIEQVFGNEYVGIDQNGGDHMLTDADIDNVY